MLLVEGQSLLVFDEVLCRELADYDALVIDGR